MEQPVWRGAAVWPQAKESRLRGHKQLEQLLPWGSQREHGFSLSASKTKRDPGFSFPFGKTLPFFWGFGQADVRQVLTHAFGEVQKVGMLQVQGQRLPAETLSLYL